MDRAICPEDLPQWMAAELDVDSTPLGWSGIKLRRYRAPPQEINVPGLSDFAIVAYQNRETINRHRNGKTWESASVGPGSVSVVTRSESSHWRWDGTIEALHIYMPFEALACIAGEAFERGIAEIELKACLAAQDVVLTEMIQRLAMEARAKGLGGPLYVEALRCQLSVHILRGYAVVGSRPKEHNDGLSQAQRRLIVDYIEENIGTSISLSELASLVGLSVFHFSRRFHREFGRPPYAYVLQRRLDHAKEQLSRKDLPLKVIAAASGFSDQSHMTRLFRRTLNITPGEYRRQVLST
ncbi:putative transcriptional regulator [Nitratireductor aquibiodomus RA22]|uniref:Putative transcriptional regulator n=1 Tax=Nitratireductor aquibiodomus RA22 TaxID=1189611 RepID=I5BVH3_9HYPH|nr:AraC family transcriptional regulator [Nitratireductor aquibiodomus]EIM73575.1 putative transcriptional regulator [Nitratireductor aquibiodomus RA22]